MRTFHIEKSTSWTVSSRQPMPTSFNPQALPFVCQSPGVRGREQLSRFERDGPLHRTSSFLSLFPNLIEAIDRFKSFTYVKFHARETFFQISNKGAQLAI